MATYYVSASSGDDANSGTNELSPFRTLQRAHTAMANNSGDICLVRGGNYTAGVDITKSGASLAAPLTFKNYPGESPVLNFATQGPNVQMNITDAAPMSFVHWEGINITYPLGGAAATAFNARWLTDCTIRNVTVRNAGAQAMLATCFRLVLDRCTFIHCGYNVTQPSSGYALYMRGQNNLFTNNVFITSQGWHCQWASYANLSSVNHGGFGNNVIANNVFAYTNYSAADLSAMTFWFDGTQPAGTAVRTGNVIYNNIFYQNGQGGFGNQTGQGVDYLDFGFPIDKIQQNIYWGTFPRPTGFLGSNNPTVNTLSGLFNVNPNFVNAPASLLESADFHLTSGSTTALNAGLNLFTTTMPSGTPTFSARGITADRDGIARPATAAWDIGAYEFGGTQPDLPPAAPTGVTIQ